MCEETFLLNYKYFSCQSSCLLLLLEVYKDHYKKENISVGGSEQSRDVLFQLRFVWFTCFLCVFQEVNF